MLFKKIGKKQLIIITTCGITALVLTPSFYFYSQYLKTKKEMTSANVSNSEESKDLISKVGKLLLLPQGEEPTIMTVTDITRVKNQTFFANAKNGDKLLLFQNAKKAVLYDPIDNKIVEVGPIAEPQATNSSIINNQISPSPFIKPANVIILNGTTTNGLTLRVANLLISQSLNVNIADRDNAKKRGYKESIVVDLTGKNQDIANRIKETIGANLSSLPEGETASAGADLLIIVGENFK